MTAEHKRPRRPRKHEHDKTPETVKPKGLFDAARHVTLNLGDQGTAGGDKFVDAIVLHEVDEKNLVLATWQNGVLTQAFDGRVITQREKDDYGPEGGGMTWDD